MKIFVSIASYRDKLLWQTVESAISNSKNPSNLQPAWNILVRGVYKQEHSILLSHQTALNFSETLSAAISDLKTNESNEGSKKNG